MKTIKLPKIQKSFWHNALAFLLIAHYYVMAWMQAIDGEKLKFGNEFLLNAKYAYWIGLLYFFTGVIILGFRMFSQYFSVSVQHKQPDNQDNT